MKKKSITENYIYNLIYQLVILVIPLLTIPYLTRILGAKNLGIYSYTYSIVSVFFLLSALGINTYGQREIAYAQDNRERYTKVFWELIITRLVSTIICILGLLTLIILSTKYSVFYKIFLIYVFANALDISWFYQGLENFKSVAIKNIIIKLLFLVSVFLFVKQKNDLGIYILLFSLSTLVTYCSFWINIRKYLSKINIKELQPLKHLKSIMIFFIPQIASLIYTVLDKTMIGIITPDIRNVSYYEQATYIVKTILMLITTVGVVMMSKVSYSFEKKEHEKIKYYLDEIINFVWLAGSALLFGICSIISSLVPWFYGPEYNSVTNLVYILSPLIFIISINNILGIQYLIATKKQNKYICAVIIGSIVNFILNIFLINTLSTTGAAISSIIAELIILIIELYYIKKDIKSLNILKNSIKYIYKGIIMFILVYPLNFFFKSSFLLTTFEIVLGAIIYISLLIITKDDFIQGHIIEYFKNIKIRSNKEL